MGWKCLGEVELMKLNKVFIMVVAGNVSKGKFNVNWVVLVFVNYFLVVVVV